MDAGTGADHARGRGSTPLPFGVALGHRLRQVREELGKTGAEFADSCRWVGLNWDRPTLTRIEQGKRQVTAAELLLLPLVYLRPVADLLPTEAVTLTTGPRGTTATPGGLRDCLTDVPDVLRDWQVGPGLMADFEAARPRLEADSRRYTEQVPGAAVLDVWAAAAHAGDETTAKAAKALGATAIEVATAAEQLWDHGIAAERDARAAALGPSSNVRARQARRGHVTRRLLEELRPVIEQIKSGDAGEKGDDDGQR